MRLRGDITSQTVAFALKLDSTNLCPRNKTRLLLATTMNDIDQRNMNCKHCTRGISPFRWRATNCKLEPPAAEQFQQTMSFNTCREKKMVPFEHAE